MKSLITDGRVGINQSLKNQKNMLNCTSILKTHNLFGKLINSNDEYNGTIVAILGTEQDKILVRTLEKRETLNHYKHHQLQYMTKQHIQKTYQLIYICKKL
jgi:hypothetical protein